MIKALELRAELFDHYKDGAGIITVDRDPTPASTKNGLMHLGLAVAFISALGILSDADKEWFRATVKSCEVVPGVYDRYPGCKDANAHDDARGVVCGSKLTGSGFHGEVLTYGRSHGFFYNNVNPGDFFNKSFNPGEWNWFAIRGRFFQDILWYYRVNDKLGFFDSMLRTKLSINQCATDAPVVLDYLIVESMSLENKSWKTFRKDWLRKAKLSQATAGYFKPEHPLVGLAKLVEAST